MDAIRVFLFKIKTIFSIFKKGRGGLLFPPSCALVQSYPFGVCNLMHTCQHMYYKFDVCKKYHALLLFMTLIVWDTR